MTPQCQMGVSTGLRSGSGLERPELILLHHALVRFKLTLDPVLQYIALDGKLPDDFILAVCCARYRCVETHQATNLEFVICHGCKPAHLSLAITQKSSFLSSTPLSHTRMPMTNKIAKRAINPAWKAASHSASGRPCEDLAIRNLAIMVRYCNSTGKRGLSVK